MPKTQKSETVKAQKTSPEVSFVAYKEFFLAHTRDFVKGAVGFIRDVIAAKERVKKLNDRMPVFGLQIAVLFDRFCGDKETRESKDKKPLCEQAEWIGKSPTDYILSVLGLEKVSEIPAAALTNARLFLGTVLPSEGKAVWTEKDYLATSQKALTLLSKISGHKKIAEAGGRWQDHPTMKKALEIASFRDASKDNHYETQLSNLLEELDGEKPVVVVTQKNVSKVVTCLLNFLKENAPDSEDFLDDADELQEVAKKWIAKIEKANDEEAADQAAVDAEQAEPAKSEIAKHIVIATPDFPAHVAKIAPDASGKVSKAYAKAVKAFYAEKSALPGDLGELDSFMKAAKRKVAVAA